jgi:oxygen-dependent protoporphyrinogen oxidase
VLGVPFDPAAVAASGIVSPAGVADLEARIDIEHPPLDGDASVGEVLRPRVGDEVFERLIDPLLGGINAGNADGLSIDAGAAQLAAAARAGGSLRAALRTQVDAAQAAAAGPVFNGVEGGNRRIVDALVDELGGRIHLGRPVVGLDRDGDQWLVASDDTQHPADRVVLATPAWITAGLIAPFASTAAGTLADLAYGDAVLVTFVVPRSGLEHPLDGSGFLVPRSEGLLMTACSWSSSKWAHYDDGVHAVLRVSAGRTDDRRWLDLSPDDLVARLTDELALTVGLHAEPIVRITPWKQSLPQYRPGHLDRCDEIDAELAAFASGVVVTGAQMRGLGLPACVRQGRAAVA